MNTSVNDFSVEVNGEGMLADGSPAYESMADKIGDYVGSLAKSTVRKKRGLAIGALGTAIMLGVVGCGGNKAMNSLKQYGEPVRMVSTDPAVSEPGAKDYWLLTQGKDGCNYWVHVIDRPGPYDTVSAYGSSGEPSEEPPKRLDRAVSGFCDNIREQVSGKR